MWDMFKETRVIWKFNQEKNNEVEGAYHKISDYEFHQVLVKGIPSVDGKVGNWGHGSEQVLQRDDDAARCFDDVLRLLFNQFEDHQYTDGDLRDLWQNACGQEESHRENHCSEQVLEKEWCCLNTSKQQLSKS